MSFPNQAFAVFTFKAKINCGTVNCVGTEDYASISTAETALDNAGSLTDGTVKCGLWDNQSGSNIADAAAVTWDAGASSGSLVHMTNHSSATDDMYLVDVAVGTLNDGDTISDGTNTIDVNGAPDSCIVMMEFYDDDGDLDDALTIDGFTGNTTNYPIISVPVGERHNGTKATGARVNRTSSLTIGNLSDPGAIMEWIVATGSFSSASNGNTFTANANDTTFRYIILHDRTNTGAGQLNGFQSNDFDGMYFLNNIIEDMETIGILINGESLSSQDSYIYNNTFYSNGTTGVDIGSTAGNDRCVNNMSFANATDFDTNTNWNTFSTNGASDTTGTLDSLIDTENFTNVTAGSEDFHLISGADAIDTGTDLATVFGVQFDIDNYDRDTTGVTWDIGADEFTSATSRNTEIIGAEIYGAEIN